jgi:hypothetical protein
MDIQKEREAFEKQGFLSFYLANLIFEEAQNVYKPNESLIRTGEEWEWRAFKNQTVVVNTAWAAWQARARAQAVPEGFVLVKQVHPDSIVHNQGLGLFKECQVIYGWNGKSKEFKDALNKGFYYGVKSGAKAVFETTVKP